MLQIHKDYIQAGVHIISANTWRSSHFLFEKVDCLEKLVPSLEHAAVLGRRAWQESQKEGLLAASLAPLEDCYRPDQTPTERVLAENHSIQMDLLLDQDFDFLMAETINCIKEARIIAQLAMTRQIPYTISFVTDGQDNLLSGEPLVDAIAEILPYDPLGILLNCRSLSQIAPAAEILSRYESGFLKGIYPNAPGEPDAEKGWIADQGSIERFQKEMLQWGQSEFNILGGCCGTTPEHIRSLDTIMISTPPRS